MSNQSLYNIFLLGIGFLLFLTSVSTLSSIQKVVVISINNQYNVEWNAFIAASLMTLMISITTFLVPSLLTKLTAKQCLIISTFLIASCYSVFLYPVKYLLNIVSIILGSCKGILYVSMTKCLIENSNSDTVDKNTSIFYAIYDSGYIFGNLYFYLQYSGVSEIKENDRQLTYCVFIVILMIASIVFLFLKSPNCSTNCSIKEELKINQQKISPLNAFKNSFSLLKDKKMIFLLLPAFYAGKQQIFFESIYSTSVAFTKHLGNDSVKLIGFHGMMSGFGELLAGILFGWLIKYIFKNLKRSRIYLIGFCLNLIIYLLIFLNHPNNSFYLETFDYGLIEPRLSIVLINGFLFGACDCIFNTRIIALIGSIYQKSSSDLNSSLALFKFVHALGASVTFFYSSFDLSLNIHVLIMFIFSILNFLFFYWAEQINENEIKNQIKNTNLKIKNSI